MIQNIFWEIASHDDDAPEPGRERRAEPGAIDRDEPRAAIRIGQPPPLNAVAILIFGSGGNLGSAQRRSVRQLSDGSHILQWSTVWRRRGPIRAFVIRPAPSVDLNHRALSRRDAQPRTEEHSLSPLAAIPG